MNCIPAEVKVPVSFSTLTGIRNTKFKYQVSLLPEIQSVKKPYMKKVVQYKVGIIRKNYMDLQMPHREKGKYLFAW